MIDDVSKQRIIMVDDFLSKGIFSLNCYMETGESEHLDIALHFLISAKNSGTYKLVRENRLDEEKPKAATGDSSELRECLVGYVVNHIDRFSRSGYRSDNPEGFIEKNEVYIARNVFNRIVNDSGFHVLDSLRVLRHNKQIRVREGKCYTLTKKLNGVPVNCVCLISDMPYLIAEGANATP